jgi:trans-2,3-dihydro-3-hydroxyanthranilate isomerase
MAQYRFYTADVFTDRAFQGAPIAVFPEAAAIPEASLPAIARELNLSETVFVYPDTVSGTVSDTASSTSPATPPQRFRLRVFTPAGEVGFAGHPMLAVARVLLETGLGPLGERPLPLTFVQNSGAISVNLGPARGDACFVQFSLRVNPVLDRYTPTNAELAALLSLPEREIDTRLFGTRLASIEVPYLIVPILSQEAVEKARFNLEAWSRSGAPALAAQEIFLFSGRTRTRDADFHGRLLGPAIGPRSDPPIGSVMPCFAGYLADHAHIREGTYTFTIDRGTPETRRSLLHIEIDKRRDRPAMLRVGGDTVLVTQGTLTLDS